MEVGVRIERKQNVGVEEGNQSTLIFPLGGTAQQVLQITSLT